MFHPCILVIKLGHHREPLNQYSLMGYKNLIILNKVRKKLIIEQAEDPEIPLRPTFFLTFLLDNMKIEYLKYIGLYISHDFGNFFLPAGLDNLEWLVIVLALDEVEATLRVRTLFCKQGQFFIELSQLFLNCEPVTILKDEIFLSVGENHLFKVIRNDYSKLISWDICKVEGHPRV